MRTAISVAAVACAVPVTVGVVALAQRDAVGSGGAFDIFGLSLGLLVIVSVAASTATVVGLLGTLLRRHRGWLGCSIAGGITALGVAGFVIMKIFLVMLSGIRFGPG